MNLATAFTVLLSAQILVRHHSLEQAKINYNFYILHSLCFRFLWSCLWPFCSALRMSNDSTYISIHGCSAQSPPIVFLVCFLSFFVFFIGIPSFPFCWQPLLVTHIHHQDAPKSSWSSSFFSYSFSFVVSPLLSIIIVTFLLFFRLLCSITFSFPHSFLFVSCILPPFWLRKEQPQSPFWLPIQLDHNNIEVYCRI